MSWRWQSRYEMRFIRSKLTQTLRKKIVDSSVRKFIGHLINLSRKSGSFSLLKKQDSDEGKHRADVKHDIFSDRIIHIMILPAVRRHWDFKIKETPQILSSCF